MSLRRFAKLKMVVMRAIAHGRLGQLGFQPGTYSDALTARPSCRAAPPTPCVYAGYVVRAAREDPGGGMVTRWAHHDRNRLELPGQPDMGSTPTIPHLRSWRTCPITLGRSASSLGGHAPSMLHARVAWQVEDNLAISPKEYSVARAQRTRDHH